jgi:transcriptional regulator with XRE-family HTH domain
MPDFPRFARWFRQAQDTAGHDNQPIADALEVKRQMISAYRGGHSRPDEKRLPALAEVLGVTLAEVRRAYWSDVIPSNPADSPKGEESPPGFDTRHGPHQEPYSHIPVADIVHTREYGLVGAGPGREPLDTVRLIPIPREQFIAHFGIAPSDDGRHGYFIVDGDSAAPVYFDRDLVPVEMLPRATQRFKQDTLYVFWRRNEGLQLKRLRRIDANRVRAYALNPSIPPITFEPSEDDFYVLAIAREPQRQQLYAAMVGRFLRAERRAA